jgi:hypothetical protein
MAETAYICPSALVHYCEVYDIVPCLGELKKIVNER